MGSSISGAVLALDTLVSAAVADNTSALFGLQNTFGPPLDDEELEVLAILGIADPSEATLVLGPQAPRREQYRIETTIKVYDPTAENTPADRRAVFTRGLVLADGLRSLVEANRTLNGTVDSAHVVSQRTAGLAHPIGDDGKRKSGWVIHIDMSIACRARA
jgi:hypothetical protein